MHVYTLMRGARFWMDRFVQGLEGIYLPYNEHEGKTDWLQTVVRPIRLYEIVFPKEYRDLMLNTIFSGKDGKALHGKHQKYLAMLRIALGAKKIPEYDKTKIMPTCKKWVETNAIGIKEDEDFDNGKEAI